MMSRQSNSNTKNTAIIIKQFIIPLSPPAHTLLASRTGVPESAWACLHLAYGITFVTSFCRRSASSPPEKRFWMNFQMIINGFLSRLILFKLLTTWSLIDQSSSLRFFTHPHPATVTYAPRYLSFGFSSKGRQIVFAWNSLPEIRFKLSLWNSVDFRLKAW